GGAPAHERTGVGFDRQTQDATVTKVVEVSCQPARVWAGAPPPVQGRGGPGKHPTRPGPTGRAHKIPHVRPAPKPQRAR
ncbi:hypothetical protein ACWC4E_34290, partial [Streptomyces sp. NPDC001273]